MKAILSRLSTQGRPAGDRALVGFILWVTVCFCAAALGSFFLPGQWYASLTKPAWTPPNWLFGPVWTALYLMMAVAAWLVWKEGGFKAHPWPLRLFLVQLALNAAWSPICFGLHNLALSSVEILLLWAAVGITASAFLKVKTTAGWLMVPYVIWVSYAAALNLALWKLNG